jgi:predicted pyridoxine 5'-phosphate oxidase superfamily flavin-nucleotide-binding protein
MTEMYHGGNRELQDRWDTRRLADRIDDKIVHDFIDASDKAFIERLDMFFIATADEEGRPNCSYKGGDPGLVTVVDRHTIAFPNYDGNGMFLSMGNLLRNDHVGLLFIDFENGHRLRLNGRASIAEDDSLRAKYPEAQFIVRVRADKVFANCPRYIHRYKLVERSTFVPRRRRRTPVPEWKRGPWAVDALPADDPARDPGDREVRGR